LFKLQYPIRRFYLISKYDGKTVIGSTSKDCLIHALKQDNVFAKSYWTWNNSIKPIFGKDLHEEE
jgi:hypothetical protein